MSGRANHGTVIIAEERKTSTCESHFISVTNGDSCLQGRRGIGFEQVSVPRWARLSAIINITPQTRHLT